MRLQPVATVAEVLVGLAYAVSMGLYVAWPHRTVPPSRAPALATST